MTSLFGWVPGLNVEMPDVPFVQGNFLSVLFFVGSHWRSPWGSGNPPGSRARGRRSTCCTFLCARRTIFMTKLATGIGILLVVHPVADPDLWGVGLLAADACRPVRVVDGRAGVSNLAAHAAGVPRGVRQRHSPRTLVWLAAPAARLGGGSGSAPLFTSAALVADRLSRCSCSWRRCSSATSSGKAETRDFNWWSGLCPNATRIARASRQRRGIGPSARQDLSYVSCFPSSW